jgi:hypothetical protein
MAVEAQTAPKPRRADDSHAAVLLVQEWLVACKLGATARCLADECARAEWEIPARTAWNRLVERLGFGPHSPATGGKRGGGDTTLLEALVRKVAMQHEREVAHAMRSQALTPHQQVVIMSKKRELKFVGKRSLPRSRSAAPSNNAQDRSPEMSISSLSLGFRPKSAMVCKSTSDLISKSVHGDSLKSANAEAVSDAASFQYTAKKAVGANQRPISAASVLTPHRDLSARKRSVASSRVSPPRTPTSNSALHGVMEAVAAVVVDAAATKTVSRHSSSAAGLRASLPHIVEVVGPAASPGGEEGEGGATKGGAKQDEDGSDMPSQRAPKLSLEEMSEERLMEQFGSISRCAIKKLRRVLAKSHACTQEFERSQRTLDKIKARAKLHQMRRVLAEEQTPLLSSTMASLTSEPCSLCLYVFPKTNLTTKVSFKSIVDLRASWAAVNGATNVNAANSDDEAAQAMNHARMTHLYDEAPVCAFCSQLVLNYSAYRVRASLLLWCVGHRLTNVVVLVRTYSLRRQSVERSRLERDVRR